MDSAKVPSLPLSDDWSGAECQAFDRHLQEGGLPASSLMEQAARGIADFILQGSGAAPSCGILFLCGPGNNGADGVAGARQLLGRPGLHPLVMLPGGCPPAGGLLELQLAAYQALGGAVLLGEAPPTGLKDLPWDLDPASGLLVDSLFGVGLKRRIGPPFVEWLGWADSLPWPRLAVDLPSGLDATSGRACASTLRADWTLSFIGAKAGFQLAQGPELCGKVRIAEIGVSAHLAEAWLQERRRQSAGSPA